MRNQGRLLALLVLMTLCVPLYAEDTETSDTVKSPSPDGRFALRIQQNDTGRKAALIEKASGKILVDIGDASLPDKTLLVWSADSKRVAYASRFQKEGDTHVYFWNGSAFTEVNLPDELPNPDLKIPKKAALRRL
jgi:hypothetical protein